MKTYIVIIQSRFIQKEKREVQASCEDTASAIACTMDLPFPTYEITDVKVVAQAFKTAARRGNQIIYTEFNKTAETVSF